MKRNFFTEVQDLKHRHDRKEETFQRLTSTVTSVQSRKRIWEHIKVAVHIGIAAALF